MPDFVVIPALLVAGFAAGVINVIAGGGSFFTLPILIFFGLPPGVANGTNRIGILLQSVSAVRGFHRSDRMNWRWALAVSLPAMAGAVLGTWAALHIGDDAFRRILSGVMIVAALGMLLAPDPVVKRTTLRSPYSWPIVLGFFLVGVYGGFLQAGLGLLILAITTWSGLDLVRGNAIKVLCTFLLTILSVLIFAWEARIDWTFGLALGVGNFIGGDVGVRLAVLKGHHWIKGVVTITVILLAVGLWFR